MPQHTLDSAAPDRACSPEPVARRRATRARRVVFYVLLILVPFLVAVALEFMAAGALIAFHKLRGETRITDSYFRFYVTRLLLPKVAVPEHGRYIGNVTASAIANREWHPADPILGWRVGKSVTGTSDSYNRRWFASTPQGFASSGDAQQIYGRPKPPDVLRIAILGGSTVEGRIEGNPAHTLPAKLRATLEDARAGSGLRLEVINAGVAGFDSGQELIYLLTEIVHYAPDVIVVYNGWNDMVFRTYGPVQDFPLRYYRYPAYVRRINDSYDVRGALGNLVRATVANLGAMVDQTVLAYLVKRTLQKLGIAQEENGFAPSELGYSRENAERYRTNLELMRRVAAQYGQRIAFFLQPVMGVDGKDYSASAAEMRNFGEIQNEIGKRERFYGYARGIFQDLRSGFANDPDACVADLSRGTAGHADHLYEDSGHLTGRGNEIMAQHILAELHACGFLQS
jgi:lysophospholipase L1-like esterase